ncbi:hypothetical protein [Trichothermofontia sp.]
MESIKVKTHIGSDRMLSLQLPIANQDIEAMIIYQPIVRRRSHQESKQRFQAMMEQYEGQFSAIVQSFCVRIDSVCKLVIDATVVFLGLK